MQYKNIETYHRGIKYRSRLEAKWAMYFDLAGITANYEPEGYALNNQRYCPDFYLPILECFIEIKGDLKPYDHVRNAIDPALYKAGLLATKENKPVYILIGPLPDMDAPLSLAEQQYPAIYIGMFERIKLRNGCRWYKICPGFNYYKSGWEHCEIHFTAPWLENEEAYKLVRNHRFDDFLRAKKTG